MSEAQWMEWATELKDKIRVVQDTVDGIEVKAGELREENERLRCALMVACKALLSVGHMDADGAERVTEKAIKEIEKAYG